MTLRRLSTNLPPATLEWYATQGFVRAIYIAGWASAIARGNGREADGQRNTSPWYGQAGTGRQAGQQTGMPWSQRSRPLGQCTQEGYRSGSVAQSTIVRLQLRGRRDSMLETGRQYHVQRGKLLVHEGAGLRACVRTCACMRTATHPHTMHARTCTHT